MFRKRLWKDMINDAQRYFGGQLFWWAVAGAIMLLLISVNASFVSGLPEPIHTIYQVVVTLGCGVVFVACVFYFVAYVKMMLLAYCILTVGSIPFREIKNWVLIGIEKSCNYTEELHELLGKFEPDLIEVIKYDYNTMVKVKITVSGKEYILADYDDVKEKYQPVIDTVVYLKNYSEWKDSIRYQILGRC